MKEIPATLLESPSKRRKIITLDDLRSDNPEICGSFNKMRDEIRAVAKDRDEEDSMLTERVLEGLFEFCRKKRAAALSGRGTGEAGEKKNLVKIYRPRNNLVIAPKNSGNKNHSPQEEKSKKPKTQGKNPIEVRQAALERPLCMPTAFREKIMQLNGGDVKLVIQKNLTDTDMKNSHDRLSIPRGQMMTEFLTQDEQVVLEMKAEDGIHFKGLELPLIEPNLRESAIFLKKWKLGNSCSYMLSTPWKEVVHRNGLKSGNRVQVWSFRVDHKPCLALIKL